MRQLASIQQIHSIRPIENADLIEVAGVLGWEVVIKKGEYQVNDVCIYCEIDSWIGNDIAPFLSKGKEPREYNGVKGERLKSIRLKNTLSQGLILPTTILPAGSDFAVGEDVTDILGIQKYEPPVPAQIQGDARGFSWPISKTDEERVQNNSKYGFIEALLGRPYYISLKLDGTSSTFLIDPKDDTYHVCGRNYSYKENPDHRFWQLSKRFGIEESLRDYYNRGTRLAIQGEVVGPGIQANKLGLDQHELFIFNVVNVDTNKRFSLSESIEFVAEMGLSFVPILEEGESFTYSVEDCLKLAEGKYKDHPYFPSAKPSQEREGIVIRSIDSEISFKAISNRFLLKENDD